MNAAAIYRCLADLVLVLHVGVAVFIVGGLVLTVVGNWRHWPWVNGYGFRIAHLIAILTVVAETGFGMICPLTTLEMSLRAHAREATYEGSFIQHWLQRLLYYDAPPWAFLLTYAGFALVVLVVWWRYPPRKRPKLSPGESQRQG